MTQYDMTYHSKWAPTPPTSKTVTDLITEAMGKTFRPERLSDRQRDAVLNWPRTIGVSACTTLAQARKDGVGNYEGI